MKWFRFYAETIHKPKVRRLSPALFRTWVFLLCIASEGEPRGRLPSIEDIADNLRKPVGRTLAEIKQLQTLGLLDEIDGLLVPHNWDSRQFESDDVAARVRKHRNGVTGNVTEPLRVTPPETETEQRQKTETEDDA